MHPDSLICTQSKFRTLINFWLQDSLYRDRCATAFDPNFCTVTQKWSQPTCTATAPERNKICNRTAKTRAIPSLHREKFAAKVPGHYTVLSSANVYSLNRRAVMRHVIQKMPPRLHFKRFFLDNSNTIHLPGLALARHYPKNSKKKKSNKNATGFMTIQLPVLILQYVS